MASGNREAAFEAADAGSASAPTLLGTHDGRCVFHEREGRCAIHRALGHDALPLACRQFPRVSAIDPRGVSVTLSHYCPTAAAMLLERTPRGKNARDIVMTNPPAFPPNGEYVGLDARDALPPLLRADMLMDWESWWRLEWLAIHHLLYKGRTVSEPLAALRGVVTDLRSWSPPEGPLLDRVIGAFARRQLIEAPAAGPLVARALDRVPGELRAAARWRHRTDTPDRAARRFLAAHAFANWEIHARDGLAGWLRSIETAHAFLETGAGVRHADLVLRHLMQ